MLKPRIGATRTFENHKGKWEIKEIIDNKILNLPLTLGVTVCPRCGFEIGKNQVHTFRYIEKLQNGNNIMYLGISLEGRYVLLTNYYTKEEIEAKLASLKAFR